MNIMPKALGTQTLQCMSAFVQRIPFLLPHRKSCKKLPRTFDFPNVPVDIPILLTLIFSFRFLAYALLSVHSCTRTGRLNQPKLKKLENGDPLPGISDPEK